MWSDDVKRQKLNVCHNIRDVLHVGAYFEEGGEPNVSEIKCNGKKRKWKKQKKRASCLQYVFHKNAI